MGFWNHWTIKGTALEGIEDLDNRLKMFKVLIENANKRRGIIKFIITSINVAKGVKGITPRHLPPESFTIQGAAIEAEKLLEEEISLIEGEEKNEVEILGDIQRCHDYSLDEKGSNGRKKSQQKIMIEKLEQWLVVIKAELHVMQLIKTNQDNPEYLQKWGEELWKLFFKVEDYYVVFFEGVLNPSSKIQEELLNLFTAALKGVQLKDKKVTEEEKFKAKMYENMGDEEDMEAPNRDRQLGLDLCEAIIGKLETERGVQIHWKNDNWEEQIKWMIEASEDTDLLIRTIQKKRKKYSNQQILWTIEVFRKLLRSVAFGNLELFS